MTELDYSAFTTPISKAELSEFRRSAGAGATLASIAKWFLPALFLLVFSFMAGTVLSAFLDLGGIGDGAVIAIVAVVLLGGFLFFRLAGSQRDWERRWRLSRFASANGLLFETDAGEPPYPGAIFQTGNSRTVPERLYRLGERFIDFGNYRYTTGSGKNKSTHHWSYLAIKLDRMLPQMVLDAKANNFLGTNLPMTFSRNQILHLEGDFDRHFTLYCPREYERDALYVFTPDLMARLIDEAADFDVEIVDDWMLLYTQQRFDLADPETLAGIFRIIDTVGEKTLDRTELYADSRMAGSDGASLAAAGAPLGSRLANNTVASQGRRLQRGVPVVGVIVTAVVIGFWALRFLPFGD